MSKIIIKTLSLSIRPKDDSNTYGHPSYWRPTFVGSKYLTLLLPNILRLHESQIFYGPYTYKLNGRVESKKPW